MHSGRLSPKSQILHTFNFKDLKHAVIGYIITFRSHWIFFFFYVLKHSFMVVLLGTIQYYLKLLAKLNVFYITGSF
jgi:hypothetical protein